MMKTGALLLSLGVAVSACGGLATSSAEAGAERDVNRSEGSKDVSQSADACRQQYCTGSCLENYHYVYPVIDGCVVCSCAPDDDAGDAATDTSLSEIDADTSCTSRFFANPEAGADAASQAPTPEDVACKTAADCAAISCQGCCGAFEVGVNKSSAYECAPRGCPRLTIGCPPFYLGAQDCREVTASGLGIACVNHECLTFAVSPDASAPSDASDGG